MDDIAASTPELTPEKRADRAWPAIYMYAFEGQDGVMATSELQTKVSDMLVDLMHFCDVQKAKDASGRREGWSWDELLAQAKSHYEAETYDEPCEHLGQWEIWEDSINTVHITAERDEAGRLTIEAYDSESGDGDNERIYCRQCGSVFPCPVDVHYV